ncbi:MAG: TldD/PmbA family protein [SAR202 cluster bacterium]|nr:TldD/PmbA family protein [SAR202 cluster bacterium]
MPDDRIARLPERVLEMAMEHAEAAEVFYVEASNTPVRFEANRLKGIDANESAGMALRIIKDGRFGFSSTSNLEDPRLLVNAALETAPFGAQAKFTFPGPAVFPDVPVYNPSVNDLTLDRLVTLGESLVKNIRAVSHEVSVEGTVSRGISRIALVNSNGGRMRYAKSGFGAGFEGTVIRGEDMLFVHEGKSVVGAALDGGEIVSSIRRQLEWAKEIAPIDTGTMPVIFLASAVASVLLFPLLAGFNGRSVLQGTSPMVGKLGQRIVDPRFTLIDDATLPNVPSSRPADDEGVPSRRLPLIDHGFAANFYYDLQTAGLAGVSSTGSGERDLGSLPSPGTGVLIVEEGDAALEAMIRDIGDGLIVEGLLGAGQSNILGGDFNANVSLGYRIRGGRVVGRVKNAMVTGNAYRALNDIIAVGSESRWRGGGLRTPAIACAGIAVSAKE